MKVRIFSTVGQRDQIIESTANTWGELKKDLDANGIKHDGMQVVVRETKGILKLDGAVLPKGLTAGDKVTDDITLFLSPSKQKAGSEMSYAECRSFIKEKRASAKYGAEAKEFFGDYTHESTDSLQEMVQEWKDNHKVAKVQPRANTTMVEEVESIDKVAKVFGLLQEAINVMETIPGVANNVEFENIKEEALQIEAELALG